jgi:hypothetical protein
MAVLIIIMCGAVATQLAVNKRRVEQGLPPLWGFGRK